MQRNSLTCDLWIFFSFHSHFLDSNASSIEWVREDRGRVFRSVCSFRFDSGYSSGIIIFRSRPASSWLVERLETTHKPHPTPSPLSKWGGGEAMARDQEEGGGSLPFREVIVSYLVPALHPLIQRNNDLFNLPFPSLLSLISATIHRWISLPRGKSVLSSHCYILVVLSKQIYPPFDSFFLIIHHES